MGRRAIMMDRDGTVCDERDRYGDVSGVRLLPGSAAAIRSVGSVGEAGAASSDRPSCSRKKPTSQCASASRIVASSQCTKVRAQKLSLPR